MTLTMAVSPIQVAVAAALVLALGFVWHHEGRGRWRAVLADRWLYGVPWGTAITVAVVVGFYLLAQGGWRHWDEPLVLPFVSWSYFYPTGLLTSGIAHGGPDHLVSNMTGTVALAPVAEYAWGHFPGGKRASTATAADGGRRRLRDRPWVRALVVVPAALLGAALLTAVFSLGPGLGFSGAVYAIVGFAVVTRPLTAVIGVVAASALGTLYDALTQPVVRATVEAGAPGPPSWASVGFQAHILGFLLGALCGVGLLWYRRRHPDFHRVVLATLAVGLVQSLWLIAWPGGEDVYVMYRGAGVVFVLVLAVVVGVAVAGSDRPLPRPLSVLPWAPSRKLIAVVWIVLVELAFLVLLVGAVAADAPLSVALGVYLVLAILVALPALPPILPDRWTGGPVSRRQAAAGVVAVLAVVVALPSVPLSLVVVDGDAVPGSGGVERGDYTVTYAENATSGQTPAIDLGDEAAFQSQASGVIVVSGERELWTVAASDTSLAHEGNETVHVGSVGWRETVRAERTAWAVSGNDSAYAVDLVVDGERTRAFTGDPVRANARIHRHAFAVVPRDDDFAVRVHLDGETVETVPVPDVGEVTSVGPLTVAVTESDGTTRLSVAAGDTRVQIAERESY